MANEKRFLLGFPQGEKTYPGLVLKADQTVWLVDAFGARTQLTAGSGATGPTGPAGGGGAYPSSSLHMFVDYANGLDANNGLSPAAAKKTIQAAYNALVAVANATYTAFFGLLPAGTLYLLPGDHQVGTGVVIDGLSPVNIVGLGGGVTKPHAPNSCARLVTTSAVATSMISIPNTSTTVGHGCHFQNLAFIVDTAANAGLVGSAKGLITTNRHDYLHVTGCHVDVADGTTHISTPFIHQEGNGSNPDSAWAHISDNRVARLGLYRCSATGSNYNRIVISDNIVFFDGGASNLAMVHAHADFRQCSVTANNFEGTARAVFLVNSDFNTFIGNAGESADNTQPFYDVSTNSQNNVFIGGACIIGAATNGTWITFDSGSHSNLVMGSFDPAGFNGFKLKYLDGATLGNTLIVPGNGPVLKTKAGAGVTTISDADFPNGLTDGTSAVVRNTTDSTAKLAVRVNGVWKYATLT